MTHTCIAFMGLQPIEIGLIVFVILLLFGAKRLPELARGSAKAIKEFKKVSTEAESTFKDALKEEPEQKHSDAADPKKAEQKVVEIS